MSIAQIPERIGLPILYIAETTGTDTLYYLHGLGLVAQSDGVSSEYFTKDALGSVRQVIDGAGGLLFARTYDPYGTVYASAGVDATSFGFTGEMADSNGLLFLRARYYAPSMGRFLNMDPSRQEANPYQYGLSNPVMFVDPSGLCFFAGVDTLICASIAVGFVTGAAWDVFVNQDRGLHLNGGEQVSNLWSGDRYCNINWTEVVLYGGFGGLTGGLIGGTSAVVITNLTTATTITTAACADSDCTNEINQVAHTTQKIPELGRKLEYLFGRATGSEHNIRRSQDMLRQLERIGLHDNPANRQYLVNVLTRTLNDPTNISRIQQNGRVVRETLLVGPDGFLKMETIWEGVRLITAFFKG